MKIFTSKFALIIGLFCLASIAHTQTIPNNVLPEIGDIVQSITGEPTNIDEGLSGTGITWDFSEMTPGPLAEPITYSYVHPDDTPFAADFPTANLALITPSANGDTYSFYNRVNNKLEYLGGESFGTFINYQENPQLVLDAGLSGANDVFDDFMGITESSASIVHTYGEVNFEIDASGTLILPVGEFSNAVRLVSHTERIDSFGNATFSAVTRLDVTSYIWLLPGQPDAVMAVVYSEGETESTVAGMPPTISEIPLTKSVVYNPNPNTVMSGTSDVRKLEGIQLESLGPNPVRNNINLKLEVQESQLATISITNVLGETVFAEKVNMAAGKFRYETDMSSFSAGNYFISIHNQDGIKSFKITKVD